MAPGPEVDSSVMHNTIKVSPTVLSSDLFTPCQLAPRVALPSVEEFKWPIFTCCGKWGCDVTDYGGIGSLTFQGKTWLQDLPVSRSHRHYGSGLGRSSTDPQPNKLTLLKLSESRKNDEILPPPMKVTYPRSSTWQNEPWPGHHPYTSHRSKFELFPRIDPQQTEYGGPVLPQSRTKQELGRATNIALGELTEKRYQSTQYRESSQGYASQPGAFSIQQLKDPSSICQNDETTETRNSANSEENIESLKEDEDCSEDKIENDDERKNGSVTSLNASDKKTSPPSTQRIHSPECPLYGQESMTKCNVSFRTPHATEHTGIGPCWPPSTSYVIENRNGSQLLERGDIQKYPPAYRSSLKLACACKKRRSKSAVCRSAPHSYGLKASGSGFKPTEQCKGQLNPITHNVIPYSRPKSPIVRKDSKILSSEILLKKLGNVSYPSKDDILVSKKPFVIPNSFNKTGKENLPTLKFATEKSSMLTKPNWSLLPLPPAPLSDCLSPSGNRVPHRLGLRFKTEAHHRFKALHPEPVPDLRDARTSGRKVIFFNYHSSAFRG